ncbi:hypothetical protein [Bacillus kwashiorkori]|uniref:hypothetical protein n=1 Tax=Bacillus kwashiorkori TaxID=1522318 RepID=UPI000782018F|nr:hypothetical protein [Bacillus kwashiorkori]
MKMTFESFIKTFPTNSVVANSKTGRFIYESIIWDDKVRIAFVEASNAGLPALSTCAKRIEEYCICTSNNDLDLTNNTVRQTIGRMVNASLSPLGYTSKSKARMPKHLNLHYFTTAMTYHYTGGETQKIIKKIVDC